MCFVSGTHSGRGLIHPSTSDCFHTIIKSGLNVTFLSNGFKWYFRNKSLWVNSPLPFSRMFYGYEKNPIYYCFAETNTVNRCLIIPGRWCLQNGVRKHFFLCQSQYSHYTFFYDFFVLLLESCHLFLDQIKQPLKSWKGAERIRFVNYDSLKHFMNAAPAGSGIWLWCHRQERPFQHPAAPTPSPQSRPALTGNYYFKQH